MPMDKENEMDRNAAKRTQDSANHGETGEFEDAEMAEKILRDIEEGRETFASGKELTETLDSITK